MNIPTRRSRAQRTLIRLLGALRITFPRLFLALLAATAIQASAQSTVNIIAGWNLLGNSSSAAFDVATVFGGPNNVNTVWKWNAAKAGWAFYTPTIADGGVAYAASKGYEPLTSVGPGEGFWVNSKSAFAAQLPAGTAIQSASFQNLGAGWSLLAIGDGKTPWQFNTALNSTPPTPGVMSNNLITLWAWDAVQLNWYFYAPSLDANGTLASYISGKRYLNFGCAVLGPTAGFWVNVPAADAITTTPITTTTSAETCTTYATTSTTVTTTSVTSTTTTTVPPAGSGGATPSVSPPAGTAPFTLSVGTPPATFAALGPRVPAVAVSIGSGPPRVYFSLADSADNAIIGFGSRSQSATATVPSYPNLAFSLAKLVPGTNGAPSKWVSYIVTTVPTTTTAATATRPSTDNTGTLVDNKNGTYTYSFYRDITTVKDQVAAMTMTGANVAADLGDLTYDPNLVHRLTIQISGNAPGTGTNTPDGVQTVTGVPMRNPVNVVYDFIPATGNAVQPTDGAVPQRLIVDKASCNECHDKLGGVPGTVSTAFHGGSRYDPRYCVVCHTDQRKYGRINLSSTNLAFPPIVKDTSGNPISAATYVADGVTVGDFPVLIHRVHAGEGLVKKNYNFANVLLNETRYPQDIRNCTKCHDSTAPKIAPQADNWKLVPSRLACGACHDGIDWATGTGTTNAGGTGGHIGGAKSNDSQCVLCHDATTIPVYHVPVTPPNPDNSLNAGGTNPNTNAAWIASNKNNLPSGAIKVSYEISSVSRNANKQPVIVFRLLQNGVVKPFNAYGVGGKTEIWDNFIGSPSLYFVFAVPQDGIAAPADFNASASSYLRSLWNGSATGATAGTLAGPDASGYYTVTLTGVTIPDNAAMLTGGLGYTYNARNTVPLTQTNLAYYPTALATATGLTAGMPNMTGGLIVVAPNVQKVAAGYTGRRAIVDDALCNKCHLELGMFTDKAFHAGQRNNAQTCSWCHTPNRTSSGWSADSTSYVHAIHAAGKRTQPFTWHASSTTASYANVGYPGILSNCETCHLPGTYDFSASASATAVPNRPYRTVGQGKYDGTVTGSLAAYAISPYVAADNVTDYGAGFSFNAATGATSVAAGTTLVMSPITAACFSCHDSTVARQHMESNGGSVYQPRSAALAKAEQCMFCHQSTSAFGLGIAAVHAK